MVISFRTERVKDLPQYSNTGVQHKKLGEAGAFFEKSPVKPGKGMRLKEQTTGTGKAAQGFLAKKIAAFRQSRAENALAKNTKIAEKSLDAIMKAMRQSNVGMGMTQANWADLGKALNLFAKAGSKGIDTEGLFLKQLNNMSQEDFTYFGSLKDFHEKAEQGIKRSLGESKPRDLGSTLASLNEFVNIAGIVGGGQIARESSREHVSQSLSEILKLAGNKTYWTNRESLQEAGGIVFALIETSDNDPHMSRSLESAVANLGEKKAGLAGYLMDQLQVTASKGEHRQLLAFAEVYRKACENVFPHMKDFQSYAK